MSNGPSINLEDCHGDEDLFNKVCSLSAASWDAGYESALSGCACCPPEERRIHMQASLVTIQDNLAGLDG